MSDISAKIKVIVQRWSNFTPVLEWYDRDEIAITLRNILNGTSIELSNIVPCHMLMYCSMCSCGNIEFAKILMREIIVTNREIIRKHMMYSEPLQVNIINTTLSGNNYPIISDGRVERKYNRLMEMYKKQWGYEYNSISYWQNML